MIERLTPKVAHSETASNESFEKQLLPKEFFKLQVLFAGIMAEREEISMEEALFKYTSVHNRIFHHPTKGMAEEWERFVTGLPNDPEAMVQAIDEAYRAHEEVLLETPANAPEKFGCFSFVYKPEKNTFILHFANSDPHGNLGSDRREARLTDLQNMTAAMEAVAGADATVRISSWLLDVDAFTRLMPPALVASCTAVDIDTAQDNGQWGQFLDKDGGVKRELAEELLANARDQDRAVIDCFPSRLLTASVSLEDWAAFYEAAV